MATARGWVSPSVLPGFGLTLGFAGLFLTIIVLIPMAALIMRAGSLPLDDRWRLQGAAFFNPPLNAVGKNQPATTGVALTGVWAFL